MTKNKKNESEAEKKIKISTLFYGTAIFILLAFLFSAIFVYRLNSPNKIPGYIYNHIFYPAVIMDGTEFISIGSVNQNLLSIKKFYESQDFSSLGLRFDFTTDDGKRRLKIREKELINKMIEDRAIEILAKERGIKVSKKTVSDNVDRKMDEYGNRDTIGENLKNLYGWTIGDFEEKIVKPSLYKDELEKWLMENDGKGKNEKSQQNANDAKKRLEKGENFDEVAKAISEGGTSETGGKLGWFKADQISEEIRKDVIALKKDEISDVLESKLGYHIIRIDDTKEVDGAKIYDVNQIFFPKTSFATWLDTQIKAMNVWILLVDYKWNEKTGAVEFKDEEMERFEVESLNKAQKDASLLTF
ncbi:MAG: peptidylprolyl isomerase [Candidatus Moranbacteria bacterium]|jgi:foldase protein PrsA|nr:peptidylprolyl isomerase [Candidatus Moranbacteria bacterium]